MFFFEQSNDSINFPLGLIKYVVTVVTLGYAHKVSCVKQDTKFLILLGENEVA